MIDRANNTNTRISTMRSAVLRDSHQWTKSVRKKKTEKKRYEFSWILPACEPGLFYNVTWFTGLGTACFGLRSPSYICGCREMSEYNWCRLGKHDIYQASLGKRPLKLWASWDQLTKVTVDRSWPWPNGSVRLSPAVCRVPTLSISFSGP